MDSIEEDIRAQIARSARVELAEIGPTTELVKELGMSSIELLDVVAYVEQKYGIQIPDRELVGLTNLERIGAKVRQLVAEEQRG